MPLYRDLAAYRAEHHTSSAELADLLGVSKRTIQRVEAGWLPKKTSQWMHDLREMIDSTEDAEDDDRTFGADIDPVLARLATEKLQLELLLLRAHNRLDFITRDIDERKRALAKNRR